MRVLYDCENYALKSDLSSPQIHLLIQESKRKFRKIIGKSSQSLQLIAYVWLFAVMARQLQTIFLLVNQ